MRAAERRYNYLFDADSRKTAAVDMANAVVILDEGHNVAGEAYFPLPED